ncbi:hypothetical protein A2U01_0116491, partial [Trifolium medium]|nr:hypothetical protein [Trifolium medium]
THCVVAWCPVRGPTVLFLGCGSGPWG